MSLKKAQQDDLKYHLQEQLVKARMDGSSPQQKELPMPKEQQLLAKAALGIIVSDNHIVPG